MSCPLNTSAERAAARHRRLLLEAELGRGIQHGEPGDMELLRDVYLLEESGRPDKALRLLRSHGQITGLRLS